VSVKGVRLPSATNRPSDTQQQLSAVTAHKQLNGSLDVASRQAAGGGLTESVGGLHRSQLYVLGEKTQMKVQLDTRSDTTDLWHCRLLGVVCLTVDCNADRLQNRPRL